MTTKQQEREALAKIREIIASLGEGSYVGTAFEGCDRLAEDNIAFDAAFSMKYRAETAERCEDELRGRLKDLEKKLAETEEKSWRLEKELEKEQEWMPWTSKRAVSQENYDRLRYSGREMSDEEAIAWISDEFGFAKENIRIYRSMTTYEINRQGELRQVGTIDRRPLYDATDWYYVLFSVKGFMYEAYNGDFTQI